MSKINPDEAKKAVMKALANAEEGKIRLDIKIFVRIYFKNIYSVIPDNSDEMTDEVIDSLLDEGILKEYYAATGPLHIIKKEYLE